MKVLKTTITLKNGKSVSLPPGCCDLNTDQDDDGEPTDEVSIFCSEADPQWRDFDLKKVKSILFEVVEEE